MPHFIIILIPYINLLNLSRIKKISIFEEYEAFKSMLYFSASKPIIVSIESIKLQNLCLVTMVMEK